MAQKSTQPMEMPVAAISATRQSWTLLPTVSCSASSTVDGYSVLLRLSPMPLGPVFVAAVKRWPEGDKPGILIALMAGDPTDAITQVRNVLAE